MLLYIDNSALNRPYDDVRQQRIWLEAMSVMLALMLIEEGECQMAWSTIHAIENSRSPDSRKRKWVDYCSTLASVRINAGDEDASRARELEATGIKPADALHLACAERAGAEIFLTCDDRLIRRYSGKMNVQGPTAFIDSLRVL